MLQEIPVRLFREWQLFYEREPFGPIQEDLRAGLICQLLYNPNREEGRPPLKAEDFFPSVGQPKGPEAAPDVEWQVRQLMEAWSR